MPATHDPRPIGVFDSGLGGLTAVRELYRALPGESVLYFGDTARLPYGSKSRETVTHFSLEIAAFLLRQNVKCLLVACNTASSYALETLTRRLDVPVVAHHHHLDPDRPMHPWMSPVEDHVPIGESDAGDRAESIGRTDVQTLCG